MIYAVNSQKAMVTVVALNTALTAALKSVDAVEEGGGGAELGGVELGGVELVELPGSVWDDGVLTLGVAIDPG